MLPTIFFEQNVNSTAIALISAAICRQQSHVIILLRHLNSHNAVSSTEQQLLHDLNSNCATPLQILDDVEMRSAREHRQEMCVYLLIVPQIDAFQPHIFDTRMGAKQFQSYFVVIEERVSIASDDNWLREMFRVFWLKQILNVVVIFVDDDSGVPKWFTYTPFGERNLHSLNGNCGPAAGRDPTTTSIWNVPRVLEGPNNGGRDNLCTIRMQADSHFFSAGLINMRGSELSVTMSADEVRAVEHVNFEKCGFDGVDGRVADLIRERYNYH